ICSPFSSSISRTGTPVKLYASIASGFVVISIMSYGMPSPSSAACIISQEPQRGADRLINVNFRMCFLLVSFEPFFDRYAFAPSRHYLDVCTVRHHVSPSIRVKHKVANNLDVIPRKLFGYFENNLVM